MYFKNLIISNQYLLLVRSYVEILKKDSIDTKPLLKRLFHNSKIANKLFAKTWWLYDNISFFVPKIRYKLLCLKHFSVNCRALKLQMRPRCTILKCVIRWIKETKLVEDKLWEICCSFNDPRSFLWFKFALQSWAIFRHASCLF